MHGGKEGYTELLLRAVLSDLKNAGWIAGHGTMDGMAIRERRLF
jgi:hypothetical protein